MTAIDVHELIPHSGDAVLIDEILSCDENTLSARTVIRAGGLFCNEDGSYPAWLGLELMAQAIAAWAGHQARQRGDAVQLGFLLGTRRYECDVDRFPASCTLTINIERTLDDESGIGVFECVLRDIDTLASARVTVFQPADAATYLQES